MSLDPTAREANFRDSIKKYLVDNIYTVEGIPLSFDKSLAAPNIRGREVDKWVVVHWGFFDRTDFSSYTINIYCCTRKDNEGFKLAQLVDTVVGYLSEDDVNATNQLKTITLYQSQTWTNIGGMIVQDVNESGEIEAEDGTKYKLITPRFRWATKI